MKLSFRLFLLVVSLVTLSFTPAAFAQCTTPFASQPTPPAGDEIFIDDALPGGATVTTGSVNWDTSQYATGTQSFYQQGAGTNTLRIDDLSEIFKYGNGKAVFYVLIDPCNPTSEIKSDVVLRLPHCHRLLGLKPDRQHAGKLHRVQSRCAAVDRLLGTPRSADRHAPRPPRT
jgi:hypothetical protein